MWQGLSTTAGPWPALQLHPRIRRWAWDSWWGLAPGGVGSALACCWVNQIEFNRYEFSKNHLIWIENQLIEDLFDSLATQIFTPLVLKFSFLFFLDFSVLCNPEMHWFVPFGSLSVLSVFLQRGEVAQGAGEPLHWWAGWAAVGQHGWPRQP